MAELQPNKRVVYAIYRLGTHPGSLRELTPDQWALNRENPNYQKITAAHAHRWVQNHETMIAKRRREAVKPSEVSLRKQLNRMPDAVIPTKPCSRCGGVFPLTVEHFKPEKRFRIGFAAECRSCRADRERRRYKADPVRGNNRVKDWRKNNAEKARAGNRRRKRRQKYGFANDADYATWLSKQNGVCAICGKDDWSGLHNKPHVDHDHRTGVLRGILCHKCNTAIGLLCDDPDLIQRAAEYVREVRAGPVRKSRVKRASVKQEENTDLAEAA